MSSLQPPNKPFVIDQAHLRRARNLARESGRSVIAELERLNNGTSEELVAQLAALFGMSALDHAGMTALSPAFDLLPIALARRWHCLLLREADGTLLGVLADPFDPDLQLWLNSQAHGTVLMRLTSSIDLKKFLSTQPGAELPAPPLPSASDTDPLDESDPSELAQDIARNLMHRVMRR
jgi:general secretion pathway protein E